MYIYIYIYTYMYQNVHATQLILVKLRKDINTIALRENGKWHNSGATEHSLICHRQFNWIHPKTITRENEYRKRKIREALEIKKTKYS